MAATNPDINGLRYDWSSVRTSIDGDITTAMKSIDYSQSLEPGEGRGNNSGLLFRTRGQLKAEASLEMYKVEFQAFVDKLGAGYMEKSFDIQVSYADSGQPTITDEIIGCRIKKHADSPKEGTDSPTVKVDLSIFEVRPNGVKPTTDTLLDG